MQVINMANVTSPDIELSLFLKDFDNVRLKVTHKDATEHQSSATPSSFQQNLIFPLDCENDDEKPFTAVLAQLIPNNLNKIVSVNLINCGLSEVPNSFGTLKLKKLDVSFNNLKFIPRCLYTGLKELENLNLNSNKLEEFSAEPLCANNLRNLYLFGSGLESLPDWIFNCEKLEDLSCSLTSIPKTPEVCLPNLKKLILRNCIVRKPNLGFMKHSNALRYLDLSNEEEESENRNGLWEIEFLLENPQWQTSIVSLHLKNLNLIELPRSVGLLCNLKELHLDNNEIYVLPHEITNLQNLEVLNVSNNMLGDLPTDIDKLVNLKVLEASFNSLCEVDIVNLSNLNLLDLYGNRLGYIAVGNPNALECIDLEENYMTYEEMFSVVEDYLIKRERLRISCNRRNRRDGPRLMELSTSSSDDPFEQTVHGAVNDVPEPPEEENWEAYYNLYWNGVSNSDNEFQGGNIPRSDQEEDSSPNQSSVDEDQFSDATEDE